MFSIRNLVKPYHVPISYFAEYVIDLNVKRSDTYKNDPVHTKHLIMTRILDNIDELVYSSGYSDALLFNIVSSVCICDPGKFTGYRGEELMPNW